MIASIQIRVVTAVVPPGSMTLPGTALVVPVVIVSILSGEWLIAVNVERVASSS